MLVELAIRRPVLTMVTTIILFLALGALIPRLTVDTDPENMLPAEQAARVFHNQAKGEFELWDMIVVGVVNEEHPDGVFNPVSLARIHELTREIEKIDGVIRRDLMSLASVDNISQDGPGVVRFQWMMAEPPETQEEAYAIRDAARRLPTVDGTLVSEDGRAAGIYVPIVEKNESHRIAMEIEEIVAGFDGADQYHITGLPVAEDTFGVEMFKQMGISAPLAGLIIFLLMLMFFRSVALVTAPMIVAIFTVTMSMGMLIGMGYTVHIMSSMIPIFLMPIAVVDSIHILSEFADLYPRVGDKRKTIRLVMDDLLQPMLYTSLTSAAGFASLALAPIPPVRVFGVFVAIGITLAFLLTITFIPAYIVRLSDARIAKLRRHDPDEESHGILARMLSAIGPGIIRHSKLVIATTVAVVAVSAWGISKIQINDNPVRWFRPNHSIRVADRVLNEHFAGTYNAFLVLKKDDGTSAHELRDQVAAAMAEIAPDSEAPARWRAIHDAVEGAPEQHLDALIEAIEDEMDAAPDAVLDAWDEALALIESAQMDAKYFQSPEALAYMGDLQAALLRSGDVGKSTSIVDIVKTVHRELREGDEAFYTVPPTSPGVAQTLLSYQSSHRPHDLWHFITPDYRSAMVWMQLTSGDNKDMVRVTDYVADYVEANPLPAGVTMDWAGLTYLNVVWQADMVGGMSNALLGSFAIVFIMMLVLFRSVWYGLLAMLPLSITIAFVYGLIGLMGKDYDMPVAVLSSLTLGLSVDFAIHFLQRSRAVQAETGDWKETVRLMFNEPARAITRNAIVIAVGFLPLLASPLVPYNTVGFFLAAIMAVSAAVTLVLLPSVMHHIRKRIFSKHGPPAQEHELATAAGRKNLGNIAVIGALVLALGGLVALASAQDMADVNEIISRANDAAYYAGDDGRAEVRMTITDNQGRTRRRQFTILRKDVGNTGDQDYAVLFSRPADVRNTVFLVKKHIKGDDDRWIYLPDLDLVKRIAAGDKRTSFVGSTFFYEDVSGRRLDEDTHELVETNAEHYVIKSTPRNGGSVEFAHWTSWIDKNTFIPVKMEYTDDGGEVYRRIEALEVAEVSGYPTVTKMKVSDLRSGGFTVSQFRNVEYSLGIPDDVFTERTLRNPPRQWFEGK